jgi:hypothetical protein
MGDSNLRLGLMCDLLMCDLLMKYYDLDSTLYLAESYVVITIVSDKRNMFDVPRVSYTSGATHDHGRPNSEVKNSQSRMSLSCH